MHEEINTIKPNVYFTLTNQNLFEFEILPGNVFEIFIFVIVKINLLKNYLIFFTQGKKDQ